MKIKGKGNIPTGEYEKIEIDGKALLSGQVACSSFESKGRVSGEELSCGGELRVQGRAAFSGEVTAREVHGGGRLSFGALKASERITLRGRVRVEKTLQTKWLATLGHFTVDGEIEVRGLTALGRIEAGAVRAESCRVHFSDGGAMDSVAADRIELMPRYIDHVFRWDRLIRRFIAWTRGIFRVATSVEGDTVTLGRVVCPLVTGRTVTVGDGCEIELVRYSEKVEISKLAKVGRVEKI